MSTDLLRQIAHEGFELYGVEDKAVEFVVDAFRRNRLMGEASTYAARILLHEAKRTTRSMPAGIESRSAPSDYFEDTDETPAAIVRWRCRWPLANGKPLADATEQEITTQIELHSRNERGNRMAREFLERVLAIRRQRGIDPSAPCSSGLSEEEINAAYNEVYRGEE